MTLWIAAGGLIALTLAALLGAFLRARPSAVARGDYDLAVYRSQLDEVERDVERGILASDLAEATRLEIKRRMLAAAGGADSQTVAPAAGTVAPAWRGAMLALMVVLVPAASIGLYLLVGSPTVPDQPLAARSVATRTAAQERAEMERLTARLAQQMEKQPDRVDGWLLLGRSLRTIANYDEAMRAFERALALTGRAPDVLSEYGELLVLAHGGRVAEPARRVFEETLKAVPAEPRARYYLGLAKAQQGDPRAALQDWVDLIAVSPPDAPWLTDIRREIQGVAAAAGIDAKTLAPTTGLSAPAAHGPSAEDAKAAAEMSPAERDAMIRGMVEGLAERLKAQPDDADGWRRLARAYEVLGEPEKAKEALTQAEAAEKKAKP
ncbi:c-type cytochrome biogenesis protein CcmI [Shumkonia mesophila]|uniref:c-type cytochrome biogenesis protein CcmI n=1 Tax=Shumkonia mesophila TaxID=2838854 RepID=UPI002934E0D0|nr:c-type cytochrome biogenesis protein CcmI [Shumkonia mesophila]